MAGSGSTEKRVCVLLAMYNGVRDLEAQLQSLADQSHTAWDLIVSDDGSADAGPDIVRRFAQARAATGNRVDLVAGPCRGFVANFLGLLARVPEQYDWLAISDQDDVWLPDRLARGLAALAPLPGSVPALYCSRSWITDEDLENRRLSRLPAQTPGFRNALVQNIAAGNTILLNPAASALARSVAGPAAEVPGLAAHDWWLYQLVTGVGGQVIFDPEPTLLYRQHGGNQIGANEGLRATLRRLVMLLGGRFSRWNTANIAALRQISAHLTSENRALLDGFAALQKPGTLSRLRRFRQLQLYRQTWLAQASLWLGVLLGRF